MTQVLKNPSSFPSEDNQDIENDLIVTSEVINTQVNELKYRSKIEGNEITEILTDEKW